MRFTKPILSLAFLVGLLLTACGGAMPTPEAMMNEEPAMTTAMMEGAPLATEAMMTEQPDEMKAETMAPHEEMGLMTDQGAPEVTGDGQNGMMEIPNWFSVQLTDVTSGQTFSINDFKGKVVLVETMAVWCTTCLRQQKQVQAYHDLLGENPGLVTLTLDIDPNENADKLQAYAKQQGFNWLYAVAPSEVAGELSNLYGAQFLNPPSAPMLVVDRHGQTHPLPFGVKSAEDLQKAVEPYLSEGM
jgi:thiol-disulfide isomerase/thioredoxin